MAQTGIETGRKRLAGDLIYVAGLTVAYLMLLPSLVFTMAGLAAVAYSNATVLHAPFIVTLLAMPVIIIFSIAGATNLRTAGRLKKSVWVAWAPALAAASLIPLYLLPMLIVVLVSGG